MKKIIGLMLVLITVLTMAISLAACGSGDDKPAEGTPAAPFLTVTAGNKTATLTWTAPSDTGDSAITKYEVQRDKSGGGTWIDKGTALSHTFEGLENGTEYTFKVRAVNTQGAGTAAEKKATPTAVSSITLASMKKAVGNAGYEVFDLDYFSFGGDDIEYEGDLEIDWGEGCVGGFWVDYYDSLTPVLEYKDKTSADVAAKNELDVGYTYPVQNGKFIALVSASEGVVENPDEKTFFENLINGRAIPAKDTPGNEGGDDDDDDNTEHTMSIVLASGWIEDEFGWYDGVQYIYQSGAITATINLDSASYNLTWDEDEYMENQKNHYLNIYASMNPTVTDIASVKINGYDAKEFFLETSGGIQYRMIYIVKGNYVYKITCCVRTQYLDEVQDGFQQMLDSFTLQ